MEIDVFEVEMLSCVETDKLVIDPLGQATNPNSLSGLAYCRFLIYEENQKIFGT